MSKSTSNSISHCNCPSNYLRLNQLRSHVLIIFLGITTRILSVNWKPVLKFVSEWILIVIFWYGIAFMIFFLLFLEEDSYRIGNEQKGR
jgi:hypothetical protein